MRSPWAVPNDPRIVGHRPEPMEETSEERLGRLERELEDLREELQRARWELSSSERAGIEGRVADEVALARSRRQKRDRVASLELEETELVAFIEAAQR